MTAASLTSAVRAPRRRSRRRGPTLASSPEATTTRYDRLPRLTSTIIGFFPAIGPAGANRRPIRLSGFQGGEIGVVGGPPRGARPRQGPERLAHLDYFFGAACTVSTFRTEGVMKTTSSRPVVC